MLVVNVAWYRKGVHFDAQELANNLGVFQEVVALLSERIRRPLAKPRIIARADAGMGLPPVSRIGSSEGAVMQIHVVADFCREPAGGDKGPIHLRTAIHFGFEKLDERRDFLRPSVPAEALAKVAVLILHQA